VVPHVLSAVLLNCSSDLSAKRIIVNREFQHRDLPKSGPPAKVPESHARCIDDAMADDDELTACDLKGILHEVWSR